MYVEGKDWFIVLLEGDHPQQRWGLSDKILQRMSCASMRDGMMQQGGAIKLLASDWPAAGFYDTELGVSLKPEECYGATQVYARV